MVAGANQCQRLVWIRRAQILPDLKLLHVGDDGKFVSVADAIRTACRKMLDQLDAIDIRHGGSERQNDY